MRALILNSGLGRRMGEMTSNHPKCMTKINDSETILSRQIRILTNLGISEVVMTVGYQKDVLIEYCNQLGYGELITFVNNPLYESTNYIYSIYCAREYLDDDILLLHGDLVFDESVISKMLMSQDSCMKVSTTLPLPNKDFKAVVRGGRVLKVGVEFFDDAYEAQPLYKLNRNDWSIWLSKIKSFCEAERTCCYAEVALNEVISDCNIRAIDFKNVLCMEVDTLDDLSSVIQKVNEQENQYVYMSFSTDILHGGHIVILNQAKQLGKLIVGVLSDEAISSYKRFPLTSFDDRKSLFENIDGVCQVVEQKTLSYRENLQKYRPMYVVHGDDWKSGVQKSIRDEVIEVLSSYGGQLVEFPYSSDVKYLEIERQLRAGLSTPDLRRGRLRKLLDMKPIVTVMEAHSGLTGLLVENTYVEESGGIKQFDAMWISSLCDSIAKGKPDIELVDMTSRFRTIDDICEVTTKPIVFDGDTGGLPEHFVYTVRSLERMGVSMVIIEDKKGLKKNSLFGTEVMQSQDDIEHFCEKIRLGKRAQRTADFMICARIESLILEKGINDAMERARAYVQAGADAIMIHSRKKTPDEIFHFVDLFRLEDKKTPLVVVPTSYNMVTEEALVNRGVNIVIYANQFTRMAFPAMEKAAKLILENHRAYECDELCMPINEIIRLIPEELV